MNPQLTLTSPVSVAPTPVGNFGQRIHQNIMESLVHQEIQKQLKTLPSHSMRFIDPVDVATYALNRLPPLYASTETGKEYQQQLGSTQLREQITTKVRQAIAAVQRDPIRPGIPLKSATLSEYQQAQTALSQVEALLAKYHLGSEQPLNWENLPTQVKKAIKRVVKPQLRSLARLEKLLRQYDILTDCKVTHRNFVDIISIILEQIYQSSPESLQAEEE